MIDRNITIAVGTSRNAVRWQNKKIQWSAFAKRLSKPKRTKESFTAYEAMTKEQKAQLKDVGGFVGGALSGPRRIIANIIGRDLITLDFDNIPGGETTKIISSIDALNVSYALYSTRSHKNDAPRLRIILPLDRTATPEEYEPIARKIAEKIGLQYCDPTTFEISRLMFWPSCSIDSDFIYKVNLKSPFIEADKALSEYSDWRNIQSWPCVGNEKVKPRSLGGEKGDPTKIEGIVGAFCRTYNILDAIDTFIPDKYDATEKENRLTYTGGTTQGGAVVLGGGKFLYSHHATDPCSGQCVNSYDLVRIHLYGDLDKEADSATPINMLPSAIKMKELARKDDLVAAEWSKAFSPKAKDVFQAIPDAQPYESEFPESPEPQQAEVLKSDWLKEAKLSRNLKTGELKRTRDNIIRILQHDPVVKGKIAYDEFAAQTLAMGSLPWDATENPRIWTDDDDAGIEWYLEHYFAITGSDKIEDALRLVAKLNKINKVKDYLLSLKWDGIHRLDTAFSDYLGAPRDIYTTSVCRKSFTAAVARVMDPGCKYDSVPVLIGKQGLGKSTFLKTIGKDWFSDSLSSFEGKEAAEMLRGVWINELCEMTGYSKSESNIIKQFLSKRSDIYRQSYGKRTETFLRQCVFFGTSNDYEFLKDLTGNRRFWPIDVGTIEPVKDIWKDLPKDVDQLWAEAKLRYEEGEDIYIENPEVAELAQVAQERHRETNVKEGMIRDFIEKEVPLNYAGMKLVDRRAYWNGGLINESGTEKRMKVCALEVWCECLGCEAARIKRADAVEINRIIEATPGWRRITNNLKFGYCGRQRGFRREEVTEQDLTKKEVLYGL